MSTSNSQRNTNAVSPIKGHPPENPHLIFTARKKETGILMPYSYLFRTLREHFSAFAIRCLPEALFPLFFRIQNAKKLFYNVFEISETVSLKIRL